MPNWASPFPSEPTPRPAATEEERDPITDRDRVRKIILAAAERVVDEILNTPAGEHVDINDLAVEFAATAREVAYPFRKRNLRRRLEENGGQNPEYDS